MADQRTKKSKEAYVCQSGTVYVMGNTDPDNYMPGGV